MRHNESQYGRYAADLDALYRDYTRLDSLANDYYYDENNPVATDAMDRMADTWEAYETLKARALAEMAPANPHDVDGPGHPCGPSLEQEQAEYDAHIEAQLASTGRW